MVIKTFDFHTRKLFSGQYPDESCNIEVYFDKDGLELEGLSSWADLALGVAVFHTKRIQVLNIDSEASNKKTIEMVKYVITL